MEACEWYHIPDARRPFWAKGDCAGPRILDPYGNLLETDESGVCERHFNALP